MSYEIRNDTIASGERMKSRHKHYQILKPFNFAAEGFTLTYFHILLNIQYLIKSRPPPPSQLELKITTKYIFNMSVLPKKSNCFCQL